MTVNEMIERLQEIAEDGLGDREIRLAFQPSWPLQFVVGGIATAEDEEEHDGDDDQAPAADAAVYITEGNHPDDSPYAPAWVFGTTR